MEKAPKICNILFTGSNEATDEGCVVLVGMGVVTLLILSKIASPYLQKGPLTVNLLKHPWVPFIAAGAGVLTGIKQSIQDSPGARAAKTYKEHAKGFGLQLVGKTIVGGLLVGAGYFFPRAVPAVCISLIASTATLGAIRVGQEVAR
ncbi:MAG: hypothetical protein JSR80_02200 [Verrucomicrobia bacterium]|nr:hypothetical protein [Verrucomicrobiota bacterium]